MHEKWAICMTNRGGLWSKISRARILVDCGYNGGMDDRQMSELRSMQVTIIGLGLMGGSLALALKPHVATITAVDVDADTRRIALDQGLVDRAVTDVVEGIGEADLVVLATPVRTILETIERLPRGRPDGCIVLDLGSTKRHICAAMEALPARFEAIGGHPMCGKESSGLRLAEADLYRNQTFVLCRTRRTREGAERLILSLLAKIGAEPLFLKPQEHDRLVAQVSHLPYFLASLLMQQGARAAEGNENVWKVSASGFRDASRLSGSEPQMFRDIVATNRREILQVLRRHAADVDQLIELIEGEGDEPLWAWLRARQEEFRSYRRALGDRS